MTLRSFRHFFPTADSGVVRWLSTCALWSIPVLFGYFTFRFVANYAVNVPYYDEWMLVDFVVGDEPFSMEYLWRRHNEHRIVLQKLLTYVWARITDWNIFYQTFLSPLFIALGGVLILAQQRHLSGESWLTKAIYFVGASACIFTLKQAENLLWGFQALWGLALVMMAVFSSVFTLALRRGKGVILPCLIVVLANLNMAQGLAFSLYVVGYFMLALVGGRALKANIIILFSVSVLMLVLYLATFEQEPGLPDVFFVLKQPLVSLHYFLLCVGSGFSSNKDNDLFYALLLLALIGYTLLKHLRTDGWQRLLSFYQNQVLFVVAVLSVMIITVGRAGLGIDTALAPRYVTLWIALVLGGWGFVIKGNCAKTDVNPMVIVFAALSVAGYVDGRAYARSYVNRNILARFELVNCLRVNSNDPTSCSNKYLFPSEAYVWERVEKLRRHRLSFFADTYGRFAAIRMDKGVGKDQRDDNATFGAARFGFADVTPPGHLVFGPFMPVVEGSYSAVFRMRAAGNGQGPVARIDVVAEGGRLTLARNTLRFKDFETKSKWSDFELPFAVDSEGVNDMEFRVEHLGKADLVVDTIQLYKVDW